MSDVVWIFSIFFVVLGVSAALWGGWLERAGPRKAGVVSAICLCGGLAIGAIGVALHQLWIIWLGTGLLGGIGLGIGYITPVSTLIKLIGHSGQLFTAFNDADKKAAAAVGAGFVGVTRFVGAIHGRILTAWSTAGVLGPLIVTSMRDSRIAAGIPRDQVYQPIYWILAALLVVAFILNLLIRPVHSRFHMPLDDSALHVAAEAFAARETGTATAQSHVSGGVLIAWIAVCVPIAWGIYETVAKAAVLLK